MTRIDTTITSAGTDCAAWLLPARRRRARIRWW